MSKIFFAPGKWYKFDQKMRSEFIAEASTVNKAIAEFIGDRPFQVRLNDDKDEVVKINFGDNDEWTSRTDAMPELPGNEYGFAWFFSDGESEIEFQCFDEVDPPEDPNDKSFIVVLTEDDSDGDSYWNGTRRCIGGANPTMMSLTEAKEHVQKFLTNTTDERAKAEIFSLKTTAQVVKEIKFS